MQYHIRQENNEEVLYIYLDYNEELGDIELFTKAKAGAKRLKDTIKEKGIHFKGNVVKVFVGSILIGTFALASPIGDKPKSVGAFSTNQTTYTVQSGDNLFKIAQITGLSINQLKEINRLVSDEIYPGQQLMLQEDSEVGTYTVQSGDSLFTIARDYGMSISELKRINQLSSDMIQPGQQLSVVQARSEARPTSYTVESGDNLSKIAARFNTTVRQLMDTNQLTTDQLQPGQVLQIPGVGVESTPSTTTRPATYTVKSGDNLSTIAARYDMTTNELKSLNNLTTDIIHPGQVLTIQGNETSASTYTVESGDNLSTIAARHGMTTNQLKQLNHLVSDIIHPGQVLQVEGTLQTTPSRTQTYTVQSGDNLSTIAARFNMTTSRLKSLNSLSSDLIHPGQVLRIEGSTVAQSSTYTVQSGDNLSTIAARFNMSTSELRSLNNLRSDLIHPGQILQVNPQEARGGTTTQLSTITLRRRTGAVETISLEEYIIGVVAAEMPPHFNEEALKAQALAARTYAANYAESGRTLSDTDSHQVYYDKGELRQMWGSQFDRYYEKYERAVMATAGEVITYDGEYIDALYFSTSNGRTDIPENVWGGTLPYLQSVDSPWDTRSSEFEATTTMSYQQFRTRLGLSSNVPLYAEVLSRTSGDGVDRINISGKVMSGEDARRRLGLRSTDFDLTFLNNGTVRITTRGWGHRVGLSQYGAHYMGIDGYTYDQIIHHYYRGVTIEKV